MVNLVRVRKKKQKTVLFQTVQVFSYCFIYGYDHHDHITEAKADADEDDSGLTANTEWNGEYPQYSYPCIILTRPTLAQCLPPSLPLACGLLGVLGINAVRSAVEETSTGLGFYWLVLMVRLLRVGWMRIVRENRLTLRIVICIAVIKVRGCFRFFLILHAPPQSEMFFCSLLL